MKTKAFVGISGFSYTGWRGRFYPEKMKSEDFLSYYSQHLNSVEINSSFYATPSATMTKSWAAKTGNSFIFSFKAPRQITHIQKLGEGSAEAAQQLSNTLDLLGEKRGPLLFQLPPYSKQDLKLLESFLGKTSEILKRVFEFRHSSWLQESTYQLLEKNGAAFCVSETEDLEPVFMVTGSLAYFRLRKEAYDEDTIDKWASRIKDLIRGAGESYIYLRHDETGENAGLALRLSRRLQ